MDGADEMTRKVRKKMGIDGQILWEKKVDRQGGQYEWFPSPLSNRPNRKLCARGPFCVWMGCGCE